MEIKIKLGKVDHESIIKMILPIIARNQDAIEDKTLSNLVGFASVVNISGDSLAKMIALIPQDVKDNIIVYFVNNHKDVVLSFTKNIFEKTE